MRDAVGGVVNITLIAVFIAMISGYLAFNINYTKAFRMKNKIITALEEYDGVCDFSNLSDGCTKSIEDYITTIGYNREAKFRCDRSEQNSCSRNRGHCCTLGKGDKGYKVVEYDANNNDGVNRAYFKVTTYTMIDVPVVNKIITNIPGFKVSGNTKIITLKN